ncbi:MAG: hypothetical protein ACC661_10950, partial [Verrucomicrobiales bacterium]
TRVSYDGSPGTARHTLALSGGDVAKQTLSLPESPIHLALKAVFMVNSPNLTKNIQNYIDLL